MAVNRGVFILRLENIENDILDEALLDTVFEILDKYEQLGPLPGIFLPFIEAFFPFLPLFIFVVANSLAYGLFKGFIYSWLGSALGSITVFMIIRKLGNKKIFKKIKTHKAVIRVTNWVEHHGFGPLFILLCFPFSPSSVINVVAGISKVHKLQYFLAVIFGKSIMIFSIAYIGTSISEFAKYPVRTTIILVSIIIFWGFGKFLEKKINKNHR